MGYGYDNISFKQLRQFVQFKTKDGEETLCVDGIYLHSKYSPQLEAKRLIDNDKHLYINNRLIVIYGFGMGYHVKELLDRVSSDHEIHIFEVDVELHDKIKHLKIVKEVLANKRVHLYLGYSAEFIYQFNNLLNTVEDILLFRPSLKLIPECYATFKQILIGFQLGKNGVKKSSEELERNFKANLKENYRSMKEFFYKIHCEGQPVIVVAAGPSLDSNIELLKKIQGSVKLFVVGSALKNLINNNIKPDMICIIDSKEVIYEQIRGIEGLDIPLCFLNTASSLVVANYKGPKYMFFNESNHEDIVIETGKSVAVATLNIALLTQTNLIAFLGQDLGFEGKHMHCFQYPHEDEIYDFEKIEKVLGVGGVYLNTTTILQYIKYKIEQVIEDHNNVKFINCSNGARIKGTKEMDLNAFVNKYINTMKVKGTYKN